MGIEEKYDFNKEEIERHLASLRDYAREVAGEFSQEEREEFLGDIEMMTSEIGRALGIVNLRVFERRREKEVTKAQNDIGQIGLIAWELAELSQEQVQVLQSRRGQEENSFIVLKMENLRMEITVNREG